MIASFTASENPGTVGDSIELDWVVTGATSLTLSSLGSVTGTHVTVSPLGTTEYTLSATNSTGTVSSTLTLTMYPQVSIAIQPSSASLFAEQTQQFGAQINGTSSSRVSWSIDESPDGGAVTSAGFYTAPFASASVHVRATSVDNPLKSAAASVSVFRPAPGTLDTTFGNAGEFDVFAVEDGGHVEASKVLVLPNDELVVGGSDSPPSGPVTSSVLWVVDSNGDLASDFGLEPWPDLMGPNRFFDIATDDITYIYMSKKLNLSNELYQVQITDGLTTSWTPGVPSSYFKGAICVGHDGLPVSSNGPVFTRFLADAGVDLSLGGTGSTSATPVLGGFANYDECTFSPDGTLIVAAGSTPDGGIAISEFALDGEPNSPFGTGGVVVDDSLSPATWPSLTVDTQSRILVQSRAAGIATLLRFAADGSRDSSFGGSNGLTPPIADGGALATVGIEPNGDVVSVWTDGIQTVLARHNESGRLDSTFGNSGLVGGIPAGSFVAVQHDGRIVVVGSVSIGGQEAIGMQRYWP